MTPSKSTPLKNVPKVPLGSSSGVSRTVAQQEAVGVPPPVDTKRVRIQVSLMTVTWSVARIEQTSLL
jgi:hypothetical protein